MAALSARDDVDWPKSGAASAEWSHHVRSVHREGRLCCRALYGKRRLTLRVAVSTVRQPPAEAPISPWLAAGPAFPSSGRARAVTRNVRYASRGANVSLPAAHAGSCPAAWATVSSARTVDLAQIPWKMGVSDFIKGCPQGCPLVGAREWAPPSGRTKTCLPPAKRSRTEPAAAWSCVGRGATQWLTPEAL
jgi:hypothetical protein